MSTRKSRVANAKLSTRQQCMYESHSFSSCCLSNLQKTGKFSENLNLQQVKVIQGHRYWCQSKMHMQLPISH